MKKIQAYIDTIKTKTGKSPDDFKTPAEKKGFIIKGNIKSTVKAGEILNWLKEDFELGHGHAMAIYHTFERQIRITNNELLIWVLLLGSRRTERIYSFPIWL
ncbi:MAG: DUF4287 domain-containing protein [Segetibacter sp.]